MASVWYAILAVVLTAYAVLDGFDFGAGMLHLRVAKTDAERKAVFAAIGPWWDGNEVWLLSAGGVLMLAFPEALALAFPAFYLALFVVIWCLLLRGVSLELRSHLGDGVWRALWDAVFAGSSGLLALLFGVAFGNVVRGLPLSASPSFSMPFFTDFSARGQVGLLDWYTLLTGLFAVVALARHGAAFLLLRGEGPVAERCAQLRRQLRPVQLGLFLAVSAATAWLRPDLLQAFGARPLAWLLGAVALAGLAAAERATVASWRFAGSCAHLAGLLLGAAAAMHPVLLHSALDPNASMTAEQAAAGEHSLGVGLAWWPVALVLALGYFHFVLRTLRVAPAARVGDSGEP